MLFAWLVRHLERLVGELQYHEVRAGRVAALGRVQGRPRRRGSSGLVTPTDRFDVLLDAFRPCLRRAYIPRAAASRMHLFAERPGPRGETQMALFDRGGERAERMAAVNRQVNGRHGRFVLRSAATLPLPEVYRDKFSEYDICEVRGNVCF